MGYHVNRQIGDYVIYSREANVAPFMVRMAGAEDIESISEHPTVTFAVEAVLRYQQAAERRQRTGAVTPS